MHAASSRSYEHPWPQAALAPHAFEYAVVSQGAMAGPSSAPHSTLADIDWSWDLPGDLPALPWLSPQSVLGELSPLDCTAALPDLTNLFPASPSDAYSGLYSAAAGSPPMPAPSPLPAPVMCSVPLLAPRPLPFHPPQFLQFDDLPEPDADLSRPPYARRTCSGKRARADDADDSDARAPPTQRRRVAVPPPPMHAHAARGRDRSLPAPMWAWAGAPRAAAFRPVCAHASR